jgi:hypothetical protein
VDVVVGLNSLGLGGTESYALTVAEHLDRLGHGVTVCAIELRGGEQAAAERGLRVVSPAELRPGLDAAIVQDAAISLELAERLPGLRQVFVAHSESFEPQAPTRLPGVVESTVALNDRVADRLRALSPPPGVVRLRQPIDTERFRARGALPEVPRRALLLSNNHLGDRLAAIERALAGRDVELVRVGGVAGLSTDPRSRLAEADIVIGYGRSILEAMCCGRAAYVYDWSGGSGWVTAESYAAIEADGFAGRAGEVIDERRLSEDLGAYSPSMASVNRDLVVAHHRANVHAQELVALLRGPAPADEPPPAPLGEMARLVRLEWRARAEAHGLLGDNANLRSQLEAQVKQREAVEAELDRAQRAARDQARKAGDAVRAYEGTLSWRATAPLRALSRLMRRSRRR